MSFLANGMRSLVLLCVVGVLPGCAVLPSPTPEPSSIQTNVEVLASDALEGRLTGTDGIRQAADHIIAELETDKSTVELEAAVAGLVVEILVPAGTREVPVGEVLAVLDPEGEPVQGAEVSVVGLGRSTTGKNGYARLHPPREDLYALTVTSGGSEEVLYEEQLAPGKTYVYRPDPAMSSGRIFVLTEEYDRSQAVG